MSARSNAVNSAIFQALRPEFFVMIIIVIVMCWQLSLEAQLSNDGVLTIDQDGSFCVIHDRDTAAKLVEEDRALIDFNVDTCRAIAVYDNDMNHVWKISFVDNPDILYDDSIYPEAVRSGESKEGTFSYTSKDGESTRAVYKWTTGRSGNDFLTVYTSSVTKEEMKTQQVCITWAVIILTFVMMVNVTYWQIHGITNKYRRLMLEVMKVSTHF